ncbi:MAG: glycosyltransferase [Candidatus Delongbacteria bacterium]
MKKKRIIFAVFDDLHHEYRGFKVAKTFSKAGFDVLVIGVRYDDKTVQGWDNIPFRRIRLSNRLPLSIQMIYFWAILLVHLIFRSADRFYSHDIFPLLSVFTASVIKRKPYVYDAHEFWHGNSQILNRPLRKIFWTTYEKIFIKQAYRVITVSDPIAAELKKIYDLNEVGVFTNLPLRKKIPSDRSLIHKMLNLAPDCKIVLYQGRFLINNGLDTVIGSFAGVAADAVLVLIGEGSEKEKLKKTAEKNNISNRVFFIGPFDHSELIKYTVCADIGLCLIKNYGKSFYYSTPNKMFEFIQANIPQIASDFPEISKYVRGYNVGYVTDPEDKEKISATIDLLLNSTKITGQLRKNCQAASKILIWENIESDLKTFLS